MKWFKHYSNSMESDSLRDLKRTFGFEGLGRYWAFIEFLSDRWVCKEEAPIFDVQREDLRSLFGFRSWNGLESFADHLATIPGIVVERSGNVYRIDARILLKLQHSDFKKTGKDQEQIPAKSKRESKSKSKSNKTPIIPTGDSPTPPKKQMKTDLNWIMDLWNETMISPIPKIQGISPKREKLVEKAFAYFVSTEQFWKNYFDRIIKSDLLTGKKTDWKCNFDWAMIPDNTFKVLEGNYDNNSQQQKPRQNNIPGIRRGDKENLTSEDYSRDFFQAHKSEIE